jgi:predicted dehydrogenase
MRAGKDVYCEKPIAITMREGRTLIAAAQRYGRVYQAGMQQRSEYGSRFRIACELIRNGRIGQLKEVYAYRQPGCFFPNPWTADRAVPVPDGFDWDLWLGPLPWRPFGGEAGHALSGCFIGDVNWAPHHYDIIQWTVNPDVTAPIEVTYEGKGGRPDNAIIHYRYSNGVVVHSVGYPGEPIGNDGGAVFVGTAGRIAVDRGNLVSYPGTILKEPLRPEDSRVYRATSHSGNFLECVRSRRQTICHPETAVYTMNAILIGGTALALQRNVKWDPVKGEFPGDEAANRLRAYSYRPPWQV